jgi:hypothetical protein
LFYINNCLLLCHRVADEVLYFYKYVCQIVPSSEEDQKAKLYLCSKYLETFNHVKEREKNFAELSVDLLVGMRNMLSMDQVVCNREE